MNTLPDAATAAPSRAELWIAYHRKVILSLLPLLLAGLEVVREAAQTSDGVTARSIALAVIAAAQVGATYQPGSATVKFLASGVLAVAGGITAAATDGPTLTTVLMILVQSGTWLVSAAVPNGPAPEVVERSEAVAPAPLFPGAPDVV